MARPAIRYVCQSCGAAFPKWNGRCESCGTWNSLAEEADAAAIPGSKVSARGGRVIALETVKGTSPAPPRLLTGIAEFDRVCGGGLVAGSALLVGGDPGIGKSTLLLQALTALAKTGRPVVYISGEEGIDQTRLRAKRLGLEDSPVQLAAETSLRDILTTLESGTPPAALVVDSIQTVWADSIEAAPGTVSQVRACSQELIRFAKRRGTALLLIGHVTKDGQIAGPRVVEHMVDAVLYFEGERGHNFRILRAVKNRFGPTDEIGVFEMQESGLTEVANPSALFLGPKETRASGAAVFAGVEGTRPLLVEIQALVAQASYGAPRRAVVGWDSARLAMVLAVLDARAGAGISAQDVYLNVAGGLRIGEPAADLAAASALMSSHLGKVIPHDCVFFGEIGLSGTIRAVGQTDARLKEAQKLGFKRAFVPPGVLGPKGLELTPIPSVAALIAQLQTLH
ncbi:MAG: DNA repair protein RadA [Alphaproteobacteria bacterium]|jgi:DNA repair protein RadA/Sms|nr:DNA repair protein RadA [Alphaproteobacteria bacterium]